MCKIVQDRFRAGLEFCRDIVWRSQTLATPDYLVTKLVLRLSTPAGRFRSFMCLYIHVTSYSIISAAVKDNPLRKDSTSGNFFLAVELVPAPCQTAPAAELCELLSRRKRRTMILFSLGGVNLPYLAMLFLPLVACITMRDHRSAPLDCDL